MLFSSCATRVNTEGWGRGWMRLWTRTEKSRVQLWAVPQTPFVTLGRVLSSSEPSSPICTEQKIAVPYLPGCGGDKGIYKCGLLC